MIRVNYNDFFTLDENYDIVSEEKGSGVITAKLVKQSNYDM